MCVSAPMYEFVHVSAGACRNQEMLDPLELKLKEVVGQLSWMLNIQLKFSVSKVCSLTS